MQLNTGRFGSVEVEDEKILTFPWGLPGFEHLRRFVVLPGAGSDVFGWLQSVEEESTAFLVVDPFVFFPGYFVDIPERETHELKLEAPAQAVLLVIVSVPEGDIKKATVNLLAPLVINTARQLGRQVILNSSPFNTRHPLFPDGNRLVVPPGQGEGSLACSY